ncbi:MAG: hypothetical protein EXS50_00125 [Candidatus Taylorbacteria bacterium]|nr:hypothetical protein [Candidatus Taylorbacteria bacterium]
MSKSRWSVVALLFALLVGSIHIAPHLLAVKNIGIEYKGIPFLYLNNEFAYVSRIQEISDGHLLTGSPNYFEYKNIVPVAPPFGEYMYYLLHLITGLSTLNTVVFAKFLFPALLFILVYFLTMQLSSVAPENLKRISAITAGICITLGYDLVDLSTVITHILDGTHDTVLSLWTRPVNPITGALFLFSFLILILTIIKNRNRHICVIAAGLVLALSAGYFFSFALEWIILFLLIVRYLWKREYAVFKALLASAFIAIILDSIYALQILQNIAKNTMALAGRNGLLHFHTPIINIMILVTIVIFTALVWKYFIDVRNKTKQPNNDTENSLWFCGILLVAGVVCFNEQIITGFTIWPYHFVQYTIPLSIIVIIVTFGNILGKKHQKLYTALCLGTILCVITFALWNIPSYVYSLQNFKNKQPVNELFSWLNHNTPTDCVVLVDETDERINEMIPAATHCNVYRSGDINSGTPEQRMLISYLVKLKLQGLTKNNIDSYLHSHQADLGSYFFNDWVEGLGIKTNPRISAITKNVAEQYLLYLQEDFATALSQYKLDYIITTNSDSQTIKELTSHIELILQTHNNQETFSLYRFISAKR